MERALCSAHGTYVTFGCVELMAVKMRAACVCRARRCTYTDRLRASGGFLAK